MATNPSLIGRLLAGRYRVQQRRGGGAHGIVVEALDEQQQRVVAIKILLPQFANTMAAEARFRLEAQLAASFDHPNLNVVLDWGVEEIEDVGVPFLVLENLAGGSLRDMIDRGRLLTPSQALIVGLDACRGLEAMHRRGVIHRDLKPANLAFGDDRHARILDVGLSRYVAETTWADPSAAGIDAARYASPEQARGATPGDGGLTTATDIYSLCLVLIESVTGQVPFSSDSTVATLSARLDKLMPVSADFGPLASVLSKAGNAVAADRYTAAEFGRALVQAAGKLPRPAPLALVGTGLFDTTGGMRRPTDQSGASARPVDASGATDRAAPATQALLITPLDVPTGPGVPASSPTVGIPAQALTASAPTVGAPTVGIPMVGDASTTAPAPATTPVLTDPPPASAVSPATTLLPLVHGVAPATTPAIARFDPQTGEPLLGADLDLAASLHGSLVTTAVPPSAPFDFARDDVEAAEPHRRRRTGLWALVTVLLVAALTVGGFVAYGLVKDKSYTVPELTGVSEAVGRNQVAGNGWTIVVTRERNDAQPADNIIRTEPVAGTKLNEGGTITLVVSDGATLSTLPDVTGQTLDAATALLASSNLELMVETRTYDENVPAGVIISWTVPAQPGLTAGAEVMQRTVVSVVVSDGPEPRTVPNLIGLDEVAATTALTDLGLVVAKDVDKFSDDQAAGLVADQSLPAGTSIARGETVTIALSKGQDLVAMPALAGLSFADIQAALAAAGLQVGAVAGDRDAGTIQDASINGTSVTVGQMIRRDTPIDLQFSVPPPPTTAAPPVSTVLP